MTRCCGRCDGTAGACGWKEEEEEKEEEATGGVGGVCAYVSIRQHTSEYVSVGGV